MQKASMTVFFSLVTVLFLSLLSASFFSVRIAADRSLSANAADQAVFSLFSEYDRDLFEHYHLFFLDGGLDTGRPAFDAHVRFLKDSADYILHPGKGRFLTSGTSPLHPVLESCALTGYTTAAEQSGRILAAQAVEYMKHTVGIQGVHLLLDDSYGSSPPPAGSGIAGRDLGAEMNAIESEAAAQRAEEAAENGTEEVSPPPPDFVNPIESASKLQKRPLLDLVLPAGRSVSDHTYDTARFPSGRDRAPSFGVVSMPGSIAGTDRLLFLEYLFLHTHSFRAPGAGSIAYETEYLLSGKSSDAENLRSAVRSLLLLRTAANTAAILSDASLNAQASSAALTIASAFAAPEFQPAVKAILIAGWAFCESVVDIRALLSGKKVAPVKSAGTWQLGIWSITSLLEGDRDLTKDCPDGLSYEAYLRMLFLTKNQDTLQLRLLDVIETDVRTVRGRGAFRIDLCVDTLEASFQITAEHVVHLTAVRQYSYREEV